MTKSKKAYGSDGERLAMKTNNEWLRERLLSQVVQPDRKPSLPELRKSEWMEDIWKRLPIVQHCEKPACGSLKRRLGELQRLLHNRLIFGGMRYGLMSIKTSQVFDYVGSTLVRIRNYDCDGNLEFIVDSINLLMLEAKYGSHDNVANRDRKQRNALLYPMSRLGRVQQALLEIVNGDMSKEVRARSQAFINAASFLCWEWLQPEHKFSHFKAVDDGEHVKEYRA